MKWRYREKQKKPESNFSWIIPCHFRKTRRGSRDHPEFGTENWRFLAVMARVLPVKS